MTAVEGFAPIADQQATTLILGSMPGIASLEAGQYYAHPRNNFWRFMQDIFAVAATQGYAQRCAALQKQRIAVWDVLRTCVRKGSLDTAIAASSAQPNNFALWLHEHPRIRKIYFNGTMAEQLFRKLVLPTLGTEFVHIALQRLPSSSPAHAGASYAAKLAQWQALKT